MNKDIQTLIEREAEKIASKSLYPDKITNITVYSKACVNNYFKAGAHFALSLFKWRKVSEGLPENNQSLINPDGDTTIKVVVKSINGFYYVDHRVKSVRDNINGTVVYWNWTKLNENQAAEWMPIPQID